VTPADPYDADAALAADVADGLLEAHRRLRALVATDAEKERLQRRFLAVGNAAKHDLATASSRLDRLLDELRNWPGPAGPGVEG
jgi:predicted nucleotidyltransferase